MGHCSNVHINVCSCESALARVCNCLRCICTMVMACRFFLFLATSTILGGSITYNNGMISSHLFTKSPMQTHETLSTNEFDTRRIRNKSIFLGVLERCVDLLGKKESHHILIKWTDIVLG